MVDALVLGTSVLYVRVRVSHPPPLRSYTRITFKLPLTCPNIEACFLPVLLETQGMWLAAKDLVKINEGEVKGFSWCY